MKKSTRVILLTIVAAMLLSLAPFSAFAAITAEEVITAGTPKRVSLSKNNVEQVLEFTVPEDGEYVIWSESDKGDVDLRIYDDSGNPLYHNNYDGDFRYVESYNKGDKYLLCVYAKVRQEVINATVNVARSVEPTGIEITTDFSDAVVGDDDKIEYTLIPKNAVADVIFTSDNENIVDINGQYAMYSGGGTATVTATVDGTDISDSETVTVKDMTVELKLDKPEKVSVNANDPTGGSFFFEAPEDGSYTVCVDSDSFAQIIISDFGSSSIEKNVRLQIELSKGDVADIDVAVLLSLMAEYTITVSKAVESDGVEIHTYSDMFITGMHMPISVIPSDPAAAHESGYLLDEKNENENAFIVSQSNPGAFIAIFEKAGKYTLVATGEDSQTPTELEITVVDPPKLTLDKPYSDVLERKAMQVTDFGKYVAFTAPEEGDYIFNITSEGTVDAIIAHSPVIGMPSSGDDQIIIFLNKDDTVILTVGIDLSGVTGLLNIFTPSSSKFTVTAKKAVYATEAVLPEAVEIHEGMKLEIPVLPKAENEIVDVDSVSTQNGYVYAQNNFGSITVYDADATKQSDVVFADISGGDQAKIKVNIKPAKALELGRTYTLGKYVTEDYYLFTPQESGFYHFSVNNAGISAREKKTDEYIMGVSHVGIALLGIDHPDGDGYFKAGVTYTIKVNDILDNASFTIEKSKAATGVSILGGACYALVGGSADIENLLVFSPDGAMAEMIKSVKFEDPTIGKLENGDIIGLKPGKTTIEIETDYGLKTSALLIVLDKAPPIDEMFSFDIDKTELTLVAGSGDTVKTNTTSPVIWTSSDESVATVDANGKVTAKKPGTAIIYANYCTNIKECKVTVKAPEIKDTTKIFKDVAAGKWYVKAINYNYSYGFIAGMSADTFGVGSQITRGQFITILARIAGVDTSAEANKTTTKFTDVESGRFYTAAIKWASDNKIVAGMTDTTYAPTAPIQRQQLAVMIVNFAKHQKVELTAVEAAVTFADAAEIGNYAKAAVTACQRADIINGYNEGGKITVKPTATATRAEAAQILYKFHNDFVSK